jgi:hypothetical protein
MVKHLKIRIALLLTGLGLAVWGFIIEPSLLTQRNVTIN